MDIEQQGRRQGPALARLSASVAELGLEYARAALVLGRALRARGRGPEAREQLRLALDAASRVGADDLVEEIAAELAAANLRPKRLRLVGPSSLTPSQLRVAELAAGGLTNQQIAAELWVTVKTVEAHLAASYRKLGIGSRLQLAEALGGTSSLATAA